jgi:hypothetical protein
MQGRKMAVYRDIPLQGLDTADAVAFVQKMNWRCFSPIPKNCISKGQNFSQQNAADPRISQMQLDMGVSLAIESKNFRTNIP